MFAGIFLFYCVFIQGIHIFTKLHLYAYAYPLSSMVFCEYLPNPFEYEFEILTTSTVNKLGTGTIRFIVSKLFVRKWKMSGKCVCFKAVVCYDSFLNYFLFLFRSSRTEPPELPKASRVTDDMIDSLVCPPPPSDPPVMSEEMISGLIVPAPGWSKYFNTSSIVNWFYVNID